MQPKEWQDKIQQSDEVTEELNNKFLVYELGKETYASPLLSIKEVLRVPVVKPVPFMKNFFKGVFNLRGQIVSVIDLREKLQLQVDKQKTELSKILVFETQQGLVGAIVDEVRSVIVIDKHQIDHSSLVEERVERKFFIGIAKTPEQLIHLVDIASSLSEDEMKLMIRSAS
jgi:purine-binding chemotaxis protein CheW